MAKCCAEGCSANSIDAPLRKFYTMNEVRASLKEWLLALKEQDFLRDFICEEHFPSLQKTSTRSNAHGGTKSTETQTDVVPSTLMITPVEIVDIQPGLLSQTAMPINIPAMIPGQSNVNMVPLSEFLTNINPELQHISNNNVPGFIGNVAPVQTIEVAPGPTVSKKSVPRIPPRIQPNVGPINPNTPYIINLNNFPTRPMFNIIDMPRVSAPKNYVQQRIGSLNVNVPVTSPSEPPPEPGETDDYDIELLEEDPIKTEDDETKTPVSDDDCDSDIVKLQFPETDEGRGNEPHMKFEVDETSNDNIETYCFFENDDEVATKRKRVEPESTDTSFQIVKLEIDSDNPIT